MDYYDEKFVDPLHAFKDIHPRSLKIYRHYNPYSHNIFYEYGFKHVYALNDFEDININNIGLRAFRYLKKVSIKNITKKKFISLRLITAIGDKL